MKIEKIKVIETPVDEFQLDSELMSALLGGDFCNGRVGNYCSDYQSSTNCEGTAGTKCHQYSW